MLSHIHSGCVCVEHACIHLVLSWVFIVFVLLCSVLFCFVLFCRCAVQPFSYVVILCHTDYIQCGEQIVSKNIFPTGHTNLQELHCCQQQWIVLSIPPVKKICLHYTLRERVTHTYIEEKRKRESTHIFYRNAPKHRHTHTHTNLLGHWNSCHRISCTITFVLNVQEYICPWKCVCVWEWVRERGGKRWNLTKTGKRLKLMQVWDNCLQNAVNCIIIARFWNVETSHSGISFFPRFVQHTRFWKSRYGGGGDDDAGMMVQKRTSHTRPNSPYVPCPLILW